MTVVADPFKIVCADRRHLLKIEHWQSDRVGEKWPLAPWHYEVMTVLSDHPECGGMLVTTFPSHDEHPLLSDEEDFWVHGDTLHFHAALRLVLDAHSRYCDSAVTVEGLPQ